MSEFPPFEPAEDAALLRRWVECGDEEAVSLLTHRHAGLVAGTARRALSGNQYLAEEAAQAVFTAMVAKADALRNHPALNLWLHRAALLEAFRLRRREARRHRRMADLAAEFEVLNQTSMSPGWQHTLTELDEALERLPESDRELLILRYYEGRNYREIGARFRKTDDTVQKQASRALAKLAGLLRRRGVDITSAALAAGLGGGGLMPRASAAATATFARAAITNAPRPGFAAKSWLTLQIMTRVKSTTPAVTAAALILLALSAGGGFYSGFTSETESQAAVPGSKTPSGGPSGITKGPRLNAGPVKAVQGSPGNRRSERPPLLDILRAASTIKMSLTGDWSMYSEDMYPVLGHYEIGDTEKSIALLEEFRGNADKFESVSGLIFSALADHDWRAARTRMMEPDALRPDGKLSGQAVRAVADAWGRENPEAAFRWANDLIQSGNTPFERDRGVGEKLLADWLVRDARGAIGEMERRLESQTSLVGKAVGKSIEQSPRWWLDRLAADADPASRNQTLRLARSSLFLLSPGEREASLATWVTDPALVSELLQSHP